MTHLRSVRVSYTKNTIWNTVRQWRNCGPSVSSTPVGVRTGFPSSASNATRKVFSFRGQVTRPEQSDQVRMVQGTCLAAHLPRGENTLCPPAKLPVSGLLLIILGEQTRVISRARRRILRHSNTSVTLNYYIKPKLHDVISEMKKFEAESAIHEKSDTNRTLGTPPKFVNWPFRRG